MHFIFPRNSYTQVLKRAANPKAWGENDFFHFWTWIMEYKQHTQWDRTSICKALSFLLSSWPQHHSENCWKLLSSQMGYSIEQQSLKNSIHRASGARREGRLAGKECEFIKLHLFLRSASKKETCWLLTNQENLVLLPVFIAFVVVCICSAFDQKWQSHPSTCTSWFWIVF